ncbi:MAG TPA: hypothetical protein VM346_03815 [Sphingomicrobium sp.]|nr:hypothetical protein [Sphingomicrobium sp.]
MAAAVKQQRLHCLEPGHSFGDDMTDRGGTSAQRIRIGLTGLAFAFLLVLLGSVISRSGSNDEPAPGAANTVQARDSEPSEPLAQLGVAPGAGVANNSISNRQ